MMQTKPISFWHRHRGAILQALLLAIIWLLLSGKFVPIYLFWGALSIALVLWMNSRLTDIALPGNEPVGSSRVIFPRLFVYLLWLMLQIVKSGFYIAYIILHPRMPIEPMFVRFTSQQPNAIARVILGNSISLTPGTLTMEIEDNDFTVHALTRDTEEELVSGEMEAKVARLYMDNVDPADMCRDVKLIMSADEV